LTHVSCAEVLLKMQSGDVSFTKQVHVLSRYEIQEILMGSDSDEQKYYPSQKSEDQERPLPPSISYPFVLTETVFRIITQRPAYKTYFRLSSIQTAEASTTI